MHSDESKLSASGPPRASAFREGAFRAAVVVVSAAYVGFILLLLIADLLYTSWGDLVAAVTTREIRYAIVLSLASSTVSALLSVWIATPIGYLMSRGLRGERRRQSNWGRCLYAVVDAILDVPIVLPPLVVGISLLILFKFAPFSWVSDWVVYEIPAVILAQLVVACAFAVRTMRVTFEQIDDRQEKVAMTLGASSSKAFWTVLLPQARAGLLTAATISWARSLGEFGPILIFASSTRMRTEVMPTTVYLEMQAGNLKAALAVSILMVGLALAALLVARLLGQDRLKV